MPTEDHVHNLLTKRLGELVAQRPFHDRPVLGWVTSNYLDAAYIDRLTEIAHAYGVRTLIFDDTYFPWQDVADKPAVGNWLGTMAERLATGGITPAILTNSQDQRERLEKEVLSRWQTPVSVFARDERQIIDGAAKKYGGGRLPCLNADSMVAQASGDEILLHIDRPGAPGETLLTWGNVFAVSYRVLTGEEDPSRVAEAYFHTCFGNAWTDVQNAFALSRRAIEKSFRVLDAVELMEDGTWPESTEFLDRQVQAHPELSEPTKKTISQIDLEKIDALEAAYDAWKVLDGVRESLPPTIYIWLEHYFQQLKVVCLVLRLFADAYFSDRGFKRGSLKVPDHVMISKFKEFYRVVREHRAMLAAFDRRNYTAGADPLAHILLTLSA